MGELTNWLVALATNHFVVFHAAKDLGALPAVPITVSMFTDIE
jgi:hypothetical protein